MRAACNMHVLEDAPPLLLCHFQVLERACSACKSQGSSHVLRAPQLESDSSVSVDESFDEAPGGDAETHY